MRARTRADPKALGAAGAVRTERRSLTVARAAALHAIAQR